MFSVLIPAFKVKYLSQAIESILKQTFTDFELIIVNDKSKENIAEVVGAFRDERIQYYENEKNLGGENLVNSWNKCMTYATREYGIMFSDDDCLHSDFLMEISKLIAKYPTVDVFYSRVAIIHADNSIKRLSSSAPEHEHVLDFIWHRVNAVRDIYAPNFVFRNSALREMGGFVNFPLAWGSDDATWFSLAKTKGIVASSRTLCYWRWSELNISNVGNFEKRIGAIKEYFKWLHAFVASYPVVTDDEKILKEACLSLLPTYQIKTESFLIDRLVFNNSIFNSFRQFNKIRKTYRLKFMYLIKSILKKLLQKYST